MALEASAIPGDLEQLRRRFEEFRAARSGRSRFPEMLWTAAAEMAKRYGVKRTAQVLRLRTAAESSPFSMSPRIPVDIRPKMMQT
jgi:hypothetical protein